MSEGVGKASAVAEIQGLQGAFSFAERLLQRIWLKEEFDRTRAATSDGRAVTVIHPGAWNRLGGPDFLDAKIELGGVRLRGDVELHLHASDWAAHKHREDPKYGNVILHVVLFPTQSPTLNAEGKEIPVLALLPLLFRSLEEYAEDDAVERLANHPLALAQEALLALSLDEQRSRLGECAAARWQQKVYYAEKRITRLGWREACHQTALEILGYRFNRSSMLALAAEYTLDQWPAAAAGAALNPLYLAFAEKWNHQAVRPANHPKTRLRQYAEWTQAVPDWPEKLEAVFTQLSGLRDKLHPTTSGSSADSEDDWATRPSTPEFRKRVHLPKEITQMAKTVCGGKIGGTRLQTLFADGFWPLLAARRRSEESTLKLYWFHGYCGDVPESSPQLLGALGLTNRSSTPLCHGLAQGLLGWVWREEERRQQTTAC